MIDMDITFQKRKFKCVSIPKDNFNEFKIGYRYIMESNMIGDPILYDFAGNYICSISRNDLHTYFIEDGNIKNNSKNIVNNYEEEWKKIKYACINTFQSRPQLEASKRKEFVKGQEYFINTNHVNMVYLYKSKDDYYACLDRNLFDENFIIIDDNYHFYLEIDKKFEEILNE